MGFFSESTLIASRPQSTLIPKCGACGLYKTCISPKMPVSGRGKRKILIVAEAPGEEEDKHGTQLVGNSGQLLEKKLRKFGVSMRRDCWLTNSLICRPVNNETPSDDQISYCRPNLLKTIEEVQPEIILLFGGVAVKSLIGHLWKQDTGPIGKWVGWQIPSQQLNVWICPMWHPAYMLHGTGKNNEVVEMLFERHLEAALDLNGRPWETVPNYAGEVERILDPGEAAKTIRKMIRKGGIAAFDYETNMLKPDSAGARIICCSICWEGVKTIAYPWVGEAIQATGEFLASKLGKVGSNIKFEERWSRKEFGRGVRNWDWCTMTNAHILDNRSGITSIKFQSFVLLGSPSYDDHIKQFLASPEGGGNNPNRIQQVDFMDLLLYCGLDSLLEFKVMEIQKQRFKA